MPFDSADYTSPLARAHELALEWLDDVPTRSVPPKKSTDQLDFSGPLQAGALDPTHVVDQLASAAEPGLMASPSGRFFGWVIGGTLPAALAADWLVSAWDQNAGMHSAAPATTALEHQAAGWLLDILGLPSTAEVGFVTGGTTANMVGLAAAREDVLRRAGWDVNERGLGGAPAITVIAGEAVHVSVTIALRYLGLGAPLRVEADQQGRIKPDALALALAETEGPVIVILQAGDVHSGAFDPMRDCIEIAHENGAWVHVDGAFGLWAAASPRWKDALDGLDTADSWATDAHKTLNVPYDCGVAIVANSPAVRTAFGVRASYLITNDGGPADPMDLVPEMSRRARGVPVWAALKSLGRDGVREMVERFADHAATLAAELGALDSVEVLNEVAFTQVCLSFGSDERTREVTAKLLADGAVWMSGSRWAGRDVLRISVSNWSTDAADIATSVDAVRRAMA
jgi:glutamate/tyrosine decarboxylase-like PLP-dependent enzyme